MLYADSAPENWKQILSELCIPVLVSPYHDKDVNPDGTPKKPHWHVGFIFEGKKSSAQVRKLVDLIHGVGLEPIGSLRSWSRYLCHLDNPEKARYDIDDVLSFGGVDYLAIIESLSDKNKVVGEIIDFILANDILSYAQLVSYCRRFRPDWFRFLANAYTLFFTAFLKSRAWEKEHPDMVRALPDPDGVLVQPSAGPDVVLSIPEDSES